MPFPKGRSGNPNGRPKGGAGLAAHIRAQTDEGRELTRIALSIARREMKVEHVTKDLGIVQLDPSPAEVMTAVKWLADRSFGKAVETVVTHEGEGDPLESLTTDELKALALVKADAGTHH